MGSCHEEVSTQIKEARLARKGTGGRDDRNKEEDFEALEIYKRARAITKKFYALARQLPEEEKYIHRWSER